MREINYSQPDQYRFSQTTLLAAKLASKILNTNQHKKKLKILDLFAGSGFFSLEAILQSYLKINIDLTLIELQETFKEHLENNISAAKEIYPELNITMHLTNVEAVSDLIKDPSWDYILLNPPHFFKHEVINPADPVRARCHTIETNDWLAVLENMGSALGPTTSILLHLNQTTVLYSSTLNYFKKILGSSANELIGSEPLLKNEVLLTLRRT